MNKRLRKKLESMNNSAKIDEILKTVTGQFTLQTKVFSNSYFIFKKEEKSICHFTLKETPDWKYGIWLTDNNGYYVFGEHIELIDKFKPGRCYLDFENDITMFIYSIQDIALKPKYHFVNSLTYGNAEFDYKEIVSEDGSVYYKGYQVIRCYNDKTQHYDIFSRDLSITQESYVESEYTKYFEEKANREMEIECDRKSVFNFFSKTLFDFNDVLAVAVYDNNTMNFKCNPRYRVCIVVNKELSDEYLENLYTKIESCANDVQSNNKTSEHEFIINGLYDDLADISKYSYKYYRTN